MKKSILILFVAVAITLSSCSENYSNGERIGLITQFSEAGMFYKSWEGHLNMTQTGMNSSVPFDFSIDNDHPDADAIATLDSAANFGWKVKLIYHETFGKNYFKNRGETDHFITQVTVLDKNPTGFLTGKTTQNGPAATTNINPITGGRTVDTIYVVIFRDKPESKKSKKADKEEE